MEHRAAPPPTTTFRGPALSVLLAALPLLLPVAGCEEESKPQKISVTLDLRPDRLNAALVTASQPFGEEGALSISVSGLSEGEMVILSRSPEGDLVGIRSVGGVDVASLDSLPPTLLTGLPLHDGAGTAKLVCLRGPEQPGAADLQAEVEVSIWKGGEKLAVATQGVRCYSSNPDHYSLDLSLSPERQEAGLDIEATAHAWDDAGQPKTKEPLHFTVIGGVVGGAAGEFQGSRSTDNTGEASLTFACPEGSGLGEVRVRYERELYAGVREVRKTFYCTTERGEPALLVQPEKEEVKADGRSTVRVLLKALDEMGVAQTSLPISVTVNRGTLQPDPTFVAPQQPIFSGPRSMRIVTNAEGDASFLFQGGTEAGDARLLATTTLNAGGELARELETEIHINVVGLGAIEFIGVNPSVLGVRGSGYNEQATVTFKVLNNRGEQFPPGTPVTFRIAQQALVDPEKPHAPYLSPTTGLTGEDGLVSTQLFSGSEATPVSVRASVGLSADAMLQADSPSIPIIGVYPTSRGLTLSCDLKNVGALFDADGVNSYVQELIPCTVRLADRFGNPVGMATSISFRAEAGSVVGTVRTKAMDGSASVTPPAGLGTATTLFSTFGAMPADVPPLAAPQQDPPEPFRVVGGRTLNPRDGFVAIIAFTQGEEWFLDVNGDGQYTPGEPFEDLPEPFVDANDNGVADPGETYIDMQIEGEGPNLRWDGPNGMWDGKTTIWTETRILYTGLLDRFAPEVGFIGVDLAGEEPAFFLQKGAEQELIFHAQDANGNLPNSSAVYRMTITGAAQFTYLRNDPATLPDSWGIDWRFEQDCEQTICSRRSVFRSFGLFADLPSRSGYDMHMHLRPTAGMFECCCGVGLGEGDDFRSVLREEDVGLMQCQPDMEPGQPGEEGQFPVTCDSDPQHPRPVFQSTEVRAIVNQQVAPGAGGGSEFSDVFTLYGMGCGSLRYSDNRELEERLNVCVTGEVQDENGQPLSGVQVQVSVGQEAVSPVTSEDDGSFCSPAPRGQVTVTAYHVPVDGNDPVAACASEPLRVAVEGDNAQCGAPGRCFALPPLVCVRGGEPPGGGGEGCVQLCVAKGQQCGFPMGQVQLFCVSFCETASEARVRCLQDTPCNELDPAHLEDVCNDAQ